MNSEFLEKNDDSEINLESFLILMFILSDFSNFHLFIFFLIQLPFHLKKVQETLQWLSMYEIDTEV